MSRVNEIYPERSSRDTDSIQNGIRDLIIIIPLRLGIPLERGDIILWQQIIHRLPIIDEFFRLLRREFLDIRHRYGLPILVLKTSRVGLCDLLTNSELELLGSDIIEIRRAK